MKSKSLIFYKVNIQLVFLLFILLYSTISLTNHYLFKTYALDLGLYTNALYKYAHFNLADCNLFKASNEILLSDHFDLYLVFFSPLVYFFGSYTLLLIQIISIIVGGIGIYKFILFKTNGDENIAKFSLIYFFSFYGIYAALSFDYHSNVVAAMLVPWFVLFFKQNKFKNSALIFICILFAKENMALWLLFICLGLLFERDKSKAKLVFLTTLILVAVIYFILVVGYIMPYLSVSGNYNGFKYSILGSNSSEAILNILRHPLKYIRLLFVNSSSNEHLTFVKWELHIFVFLSGLYLLFVKPQYLIMLIPIYMQKMFHNDSRMWGIGGHYSIEFAPILAMGAFAVVSEIKNSKLKLILKYWLVISVISITIRSMDQTYTYTKKSQIRFYQKAHYQNDFDVNEVYDVLKKVPKNASVSALSYFVPNLALRDKIYQFPIVKDADFIIFNYTSDYYPLNSFQFISEIKKYSNSKEWVYFYNSFNISILKRK